MPAPGTRAPRQAARMGAAAQMTAMELSGHDLACIRSGREVFSGVSFAVPGGRALVLTGANGAGKSSLLRVIAGLVTPASGSVALAGGDPELSVAEQCHYTGHLDPLKPALTVTENLRFWARYLNGGRPDSPGIEATAITAALHAVGLDDLGALPAGYLSAGQKRRLSLARLACIPRPVWLLDEPTAALDAAATERLRRLMADHLAGDGVIVAATHGPLGLAGAAELALGAAPIAAQP